MKAYFTKYIFRFLFLIALLGTQLGSKAQDVIFETQADIDAFDPAIIEINGRLQIGVDSIDSDINQLSNLSNITSVKGEVSIWKNTNLTNLDGLSNITNIIGDLTIYGNTSLINFDGLSNLISIERNLYVAANDNLENFGGLDNLTSIGEALAISINENLINLSGLDNLTSIGEYLSIRNNNRLTNLDGLSKLTSLEESLIIWDNNRLTNIDGLSNLTSISTTLSLKNNDDLINFNGLSNLISVLNISIVNNDNLLNVDWLNNITSVEGYIYITDNDNLINVDGLNNLTSIGFGLLIDDNINLPNVDGLNNLISIGTFLNINNNQNLADCCGIQSLLENQATAIGDFISIYANPSECSSEVEALTANCRLRLIVDVTPPCTGVENGYIQVFVKRYTITPFSYKWARQEDGLTGNGISESDNFTINMLGVGTYNLTVTNTAPDTAIVLDIVVSENAGSIFEIIEVKTTNSSNGMNNGSIKLATTGGTGPYTYSWLGVGSGSVSEVADSFYAIPSLYYGEYIITVEDVTGTSKVIEIALLDETVQVILCKSPLDIVILNDVSSSVDVIEYKESKQFFVDFLKEVNIGTGVDESRAAIIEWASSNEQEVKIPITGDMTILSTYLDDSRAFNNATSSHQAMKFGELYLDTNARLDVEKVLILSTDATSGQISSSLVVLADELKAKGYHIITLAFDAAFSNHITRDILRKVASVDALAPGAPSYSELDADLAKNIVFNYLCPIDPGSSATAFFNRDGAIDIIEINPVGNCPYPNFVEVTIDISAYRELSIPAGTPITFYHNDPNQSGATPILTWEIPCAIAVDSTETYTITLPMNGPSNIFAVLNDDGLQGLPISFPITDIEEIAYSNNIDNERICLDEEATIQAFKYSSLPVPSCDTLVNYTINVCNISEVDAFGVSVTDIAPPGFVLIGNIFNDSGCATDMGGNYDIPADCCFSLFLTYDAAGAAYGYYGDQDVDIDGPNDQTYIDFDGSTTTDEDVTIDGSIDCPSTTITFSKSVNVDESCDDGFVEFTFTINNEMNIPLKGLIFRDMLPDPCTWTYIPYGESGLSFANTSVVGNEAVFMIDEVQANTVATFYMDASLNSWPNDGTLNNTATLENVPDVINGGFRTLTSNTTNTQITASPNITLPDTIIANTANDTIILEVILSALADVYWTTEGDGQFIDDTLESTMYIVGNQDMLDGEVMLFVSVVSDCNETGAPVLIQFVDCSLEIEIIEIGACDNMGTPLDGSDDTYDVINIVTGDNVGQDSMFVISIDTYADTLAYFTQHTLTLPADGTADTLSFVDIDFMFCSTEIVVNQEVCTVTCNLIVDDLMISDCGDNETPQDSTDDIYQIEFTAFASNPSNDSTFTTLYNGQVDGPFSYGDITSLTLSADSVLDSIWVADSSFDTCGVWIFAHQDNCYSDLLCSISIDSLTTSDCDDNGTPQDSTDDTYIVDFIIDLDTTYHIIQEMNILGPFENNIQGSISLSADNVPDTLLFAAIDNDNCFIQEVVNQNSCSTETTVIDSSEIIIPNIFSPNGDKINDEWFVTILGENIKLLECSIFDRWGNNVFYSIDNKTIWNGQYKQKPVIEGVYVYVITYVNSNGLEKKIAGDITVIF